MSITLSVEEINKFNTLLKKEEEFKQANRRRATKYYHKHFKLNDNMSEEERQIVSENIKERQKKFSDKYLNNRQFYIARQKQYRKNKLEKLKAEEDKL